jgi:hypothetical protein
VTSRGLVVEKFGKYTESENDSLHSSEDEMAGNRISVL